MTQTARKSEPDRALQAAGTPEFPDTRVLWECIPCECQTDERVMTPPHVASPKPNDPRSGPGADLQSVVAISGLIGRAQAPVGVSASRALADAVCGRYCTQTAEEVGFS